MPWNMTHREELPPIRSSSSLCKIHHINVTQGVYNFEIIAMNRPQLYVDSKKPLYLHGNCFF